MIDTTTTSRSPTARLPRRLSAENRREQIMQAAARLFTERGFEGVSMADLSSHLQTSRATIYTYFPSTEAILDALFQERLCALQAQLSPHVRGGQPVYREIMALMQSEQDTVRLLNSGGGPQFREQRQRFVNVIRSWLLAEAPAPLPEREWLLDLVIQFLLTAANQQVTGPAQPTQWLVLEQFIDGGIEAVRKSAP